MTAVRGDKLWGKARLEALSDGVFAIVMTLIVLDIRLPEKRPHAPTSDDLYALAALGPVFFSFVMTFMLTGSFWFLHHVTFHNTKYVTRGLCAINVLFLMFVSLLPFSTGLLGRIGPGHPVAQIVYFSNQLALGLVLNLHWAYARSHGLLVDPIEDPRSRMAIAIQPLACVLALATVAFPPVSYYAFLFGMLGGRVVARRRFKALPADAPAPL